jgi:hypothetical protein
MVAFIAQLGFPSYGMIRAFTATSPAFLGSNEGSLCIGIIKTNVMSWAIFTKYFEFEFSDWLKTPAV